MPEFSGTSWKDLEDIWPADVRVSSDAWKMMSVFYPAWLATTAFMKATLNGEFIRHQEFWVLCLIQRCEEARENVATEVWPPMKAMNIGGHLWALRKSKLTKLGLIENMPAPYLRLVRVTGIGKMIIKTFISNVEQAHRDIKHWNSLQPAENAEKVNQYFQKYCFNPDKNEVAPE